MNFYSTMKAFFILSLFAHLWIVESSRVSIGSRIVGGENATAGQFPYAAAIYKSTANGNYFCTGSILTLEWILTAGQCVDGATLFTILVGTHRLNPQESSAEKLATSEYVLHPEYNAVTLENDIGLIKLRMALTYTDYIRPLYLPLIELVPGATGLGYGWGQISDDSSELSNTLQWVSLAAVSDEECRITYGGQLRQNMVCFEGNYNQGTCLGDSGSPVVQHYKAYYYMVVAISSFYSANGCESTDPSGYTDVWPYNDWINSVIYERKTA